jgi:Lrp/AsnC family transcriptional regulator for asnA, asnC and gidA
LATKKKAVKTKVAKAEPIVAPASERKRRSAPHEMDEIDERIVAAMRPDGRISNRDLAKIVGVNEATVRTRVRRLEQANNVRVVAIRDLGAMGFGALAAVGVQVKGRSVVEVGEDLARIPQVMTVNATIGVYDIELQVVAKDIEEMANLLTNEIPKVRGVVRLSPGLALNVLKYESQWAPLL